MFDSLSGWLLGLGFIVVVIAAMISSYIMLGIGLAIMALAIVFRAIAMR